MPRALVLVGVKHTGKSLVAKLIGNLSGRLVVDTDELLSDFYEKRSGTRLAVRDIYRLDDGDTFRSLEAEACREAVGRARHCVVAAGGGVCDNVEAMDAMKDATLVALDEEAETLFDRIMKNGVPAYLTGEEPSERRREFASLHARRSALYRQQAAFVVRITGRTPMQVAEEVLQLVEDHRDGGK